MRSKVSRHTNKRHHWRRLEASRTHHLVTKKLSGMICHRSTATEEVTNLLQYRKVHLAFQMRRGVNGWKHATIVSSQMPLDMPRCTVATRGYPKVVHIEQQEERWAVIGRLVMEEGADLQLIEHGKAATNHIIL